MQKSLVAALFSALTLSGCGIGSAITVAKQVTNDCVGLNEMEKLVKVVAEKGDEKALSDFYSLKKEINTTLAKEGISYKNIYFPPSDIDSKDRLNLYSDKKCNQRIGAISEDSKGNTVFLKK